MTRQKGKKETPPHSKHNGVMPSLTINYAHHYELFYYMHSLRIHTFCWLSPCEVDRDCEEQVRPGGV